MTIRAFLSRTFSRLSHGTDPQGVSGVGVKKTEWFQGSSYAATAFFAAKTGKILKGSRDSTYYCYLEDGRIFKKPSHSDQWKEVYPDIKGELFYNSVLDETVEKAKKDGMVVEEHPGDLFSRTISQRQFIIYNGTDEQVEKIDETHPIPERTTITFDTTGCDPDILNPQSDYDGEKPKHGEYGLRAFY